MWKRVWNDPVWSKVISAAILAAASAVGIYFLDWWPAIAAWVRSVLSYLLQTTAVRNWLLFLTILLALPTLIFLVLLLWETIRPSNAGASSWRDYTSDEFFGIRWRWEWYSNGSLSKFTVYCPHCDYQLFPLDATAYRIGEWITFHCDSCGVRFKEFPESFDSLEMKARRFVQQKVRRGLQEQRSASNP